MNNEWGGLVRDTCHPSLPALGTADPVCVPGAYRQQGWSPTRLIYLGLGTLQALPFYLWGLLVFAAALPNVRPRLGLVPGSSLGDANL